MLSLDDADVAAPFFFFDVARGFVYGPIVTAPSRSSRRVVTSIWHSLQNDLFIMLRSGGTGPRPRMSTFPIEINYGPYIIIRRRDTKSSLFLAEQRRLARHVRRGLESRVAVR